MSSSAAVVNPVGRVKILASHEATGSLVHAFPVRTPFRLCKENPVLSNKPALRNRLARQANKD